MDPELIGAEFEISQHSVEVLSPFDPDFYLSQYIVEVIGVVGRVRVSSHSVLVLTRDPLSEEVRVTGSRGKNSSLGFGTSGYVVVEGAETFQPPVSFPVNPIHVFFRENRTNIAARYSGAQITDIHSEQRPSFIAPWNAVRITSDPSDRFITVTYGLEARLDIISLIQYGREDLWWVIAQANDITNPFEEPMTGDRIRIPSITRALSVLGQVGSGTELSRYEEE